MSKKKKIVLAVAALVALTFLVAAVGLYCLLTNQPAELIETLSAKNKAAEYLRGKYGDSPAALSAEPVYTGGSLFDRGRLCGAVVHYGDFDVLIADDTIADDRQYDDIVAAFTKKYLSVDEIYAEMTERTVALDLGIKVASKDYGEFTDLYFDGDIEGFLSRVNPALTVRLDGRGYHDKSAETPALLYEALERIYCSTSGEMRVYAYVFDPTLDLPDSPMEDGSYGAYLRYPPKRYDEYMELIAAGSAIRGQLPNGVKVERPSFYQIDEFTAISDNDITSPITSERDFFLTAKDFSDDRTVYRGRYKYDDRAEENVLTVREDGLYCGVNTRGHDFMLRLDRAHYGITDRTIALRVTPPVTSAEPWHGKRLYLSFGYDGYDSDENHWYYMDEKYLYLYVPYLCSDLSSFEEERGVYVAFAEGE
ncbi:MAG: hypothetical protein NC084_07075 [Bacteroides sp.]|nr:hypothetical protein [Eubacterium sp.]MCM1418363.1 hypothetical protein [Roseburia sp.]MCM1462463.1 hypothetical protein [Bacteroides sp.]